MSAVRHAAYRRYDELTESEQRRYHATLAAKRREFPHVYDSPAAKAGLVARIIRERLCECGGPAEECGCL